MQADFDMKLIGRNYVQRGAAILLLVFVLVDISSTDICGEKLELLGFSDSFIASFRDCNVGTTPIPTRASIEATEQDQPTNSSPQDDDCLCWCPHVLPSLVFHFRTSMIEPPKADPANTTLPSAPPQSLFHPPRLA